MTKRKPGGQRKCTATSRRTGRRCGHAPVPGALVCRWHGGAAKQVRQRAVVVAELESWGLGDAHVDPGEVLLRLVAQSAARAEWYAGLLRRAYDAAEEVQQLQADHELINEHGLDAIASDPDHPQSARAQHLTAELQHVFTAGGVSALVGQVYSATALGNVYATGEAIRGLVQLEASERDRCAGFAAKAVQAGLAERQVRLAERMGEHIVDVLEGVLAELGLADDLIGRVPDLVERHLDIVVAG